jgi:hypothetical protein
MDLDSSELQLLVWAVPNEVINGLRVDDFPGKIGVSKADFKRFALRLRQSEHTAAQLEKEEARAFRNALSLVLVELGEDEFQTRTGFNFEMGQQLLLKMDAARGFESRE